MNDFKSSCLNSGSDVAAPAKTTNEVMMPSSMSMPAIASAKPAPQFKYVESLFVDETSCLT